MWLTDTDVHFLIWDSDLLITVTKLRADFKGRYNNCTVLSYW